MTKNFKIAVFGFLAQAGRKDPPRSLLTSPPSHTHWDGREKKRYKSEKTHGSKSRQRKHSPDARKTDSTWGLPCNMPPPPDTHTLPTTPYTL